MISHISSRSRLRYQSSHRRPKAGHKRGRRHPPEPDLHLLRAIPKMRWRQCVCGTSLIDLNLSHQASETHSSELTRSTAAAGMVVNAADHAVFSLSSVSFDLP